MDLVLIAVISVSIVFMLFVLTNVTREIKTGPRRVELLSFRRSSRARPGQRPARSNVQVIPAQLFQIEKNEMASGMKIVHRHRLG